ncbi:phenylalanine--tRNA ligase alpha subunit, cytoplasmic-like [Malus sylvestris]|uniref:phenylalanine--tRNA ligase alpha subunit, cytoplasmic-like n=1 Tax=Malus sylvestris TaxID=3752 RepID=UPI0021AD4E59|nr:phenylalanine--tRNA ligase alpha subunit, cytoplasmic-like [Malus sylvestris]
MTMPAETTICSPKYYSLDRVIRNEAPYRTPLAEFHQIEGLVCDRGLGLGDLLGELEEFFSRRGKLGLIERNPICRVGL